MRRFIKEDISNKGIVLLATLSLFWGLNWPGLKIILNELPVWWTRSSCLVIGGLILLVASASSGKRWQIRRSELLSVGTCGFFNICLWNLLSAYGVSIMPAGRASIIAFTMPLWATIFAFFILGEKINKIKILGLVFGLFGMVVLIGPDYIELKKAPLGAMFMLSAAISWGLGTVLMKKGNWSIPVISHVAWQLLLSSIPVVVGALILEPFPDLITLSGPAIIALIYIYTFPMAYCQWAYMNVVKMLPASAAAIGTLAIPIVGVYSSHLILSERVGIRELAALMLVCGSMTFVLVIPAMRSRSYRSGK